MTSYKKMYEELKDSIKPYETDFKCPICSKPIIISLSQLYCKNDNCTWNPTINDILPKLYERSD